jgi:high-affinity iron transporter
LVHLLDYLAKDYGGAVAHGKILSQSEYHEQLEFSASAMEAGERIPELSGDGGIQRSLKNLNGLIQAKAEAANVASLARQIQARVIRVTHLEIAPARWPSLKRGARIFAENCASCHGERGAGDGPAGKSLDPHPANFQDSHMDEVSPFQAFNTVRIGVPGTGMPPFHALSDGEAWDVAFYVVALRHDSSRGAGARPPFAWDTAGLDRVATSSDRTLKDGLSGRSDDDRNKVLALLRTHSDDDSDGGSLGTARGLLDSSITAYLAGDREEAKTRALKAYLEGIEPVEPRLRASDPGAVTELEEKMAAVRGAIEAGKPPAEVRAAITLALQQIAKAEALLNAGEMSPWIAFLAAAAILLREGFEAVLVVIALLGVIRAANVPRAALWVHGGWISALALGAVAWFFSGWLMGISGAQRETLEGVTSLFAVAVLLVVGFWLHSQTEIGRWKKFIHGKVQKALEGRNLWGLASISFVAVFREAFETVLFLRAIWLEGGGDAKIAMAVGVFGSLALVIGLAWAILRYSATLPIRRLFEGSAVVMAGLAVVLTGKGLHSLQETGLLTVTNSAMPFHADLVGLYPTWETLASQILILIFVLALWTYGKRPSHSARR